MGIIRRKRRYKTENKKYGNDCGSEQLLLPLNVACCQDNSSAAGYRNGTSSNNVGSNGNYWSSTLNESNTNNAWNLNFNSGNHNMNNNNRNNGHTVRPVTENTTPIYYSSIYPVYVISREQLLIDLLKAYKDARRHKRRTRRQIEFEMNMETRLVELRDEIWERRYTPGRSTCFIITDPKKREVFAAEFRDRVVHHLFYNYTHELFERTFIEDSYSCRKNKGTHYGIARLKQHIASCSDNYHSLCYVLKSDIKGYFMNINRERLLKMCLMMLDKMALHASDRLGYRWIEVLDYDLLRYLCRVIVLNDPVENCIMKGNPQNWDDLPPSKSLFKTERGCGLPIGNLTSQLFSNVYLNEFDQFMKRVCGCKHYGRYVDDAFVVDRSKKRLRKLIESIETFLHQNLDLSLHPDKTIIKDVIYGIEFLGAYVKPYRSYVRNGTKRRIIKKLRALETDTDTMHLSCSLNSYLGILSHYASYKMRKKMFAENQCFISQGDFSTDLKRFKLK